MVGRAGVKATYAAGKWIFEKAGKTLSGKAAQEEYLIFKKEVVQQIGASDVTWTNYKNTHIVDEGANWKEVVKSTKGNKHSAKYYPGTPVEMLERYVWANGTPVSNGKTWKVMEFDHIVGACDGKPVRWCASKRREERYTGTQLHWKNSETSRRRGEPMRTHIISVDDVAPATITFDTLELDPDLPLEAQARWDLKEDLLMAEFPNGCALAIGWRPSFDPAGRFYVELNQRTENWEPFAEQQCRTILELKAIVSEFVRIARKRPSIPQNLLNSVTVQPASPLSDDLILDPLAPPEQQLERLRDDMFRAFLGLYRIRLDWLPPHSPAGEFVISLSRARSERDFDEPPEPVVERRCRGIPEMLAIFKEFIEQAKQADASEAQENRK